MASDESQNDDVALCVGCDKELTEFPLDTCGSCGEVVCTDCLVSTGPQALGATELCPKCAEENEDEGDPPRECYRCSKRLDDLEDEDVRTCEACEEQFCKYCCEAVEDEEGNEGRDLCGSCYNEEFETAKESV